MSISSKTYQLKGLTAFQIVLLTAVWHRRVPQSKIAAGSLGKVVGTRVALFFKITAGLDALKLDHRSDHHNLKMGHRGDHLNLKMGHRRDHLNLKMDHRSDHHNLKMGHRGDHPNLKMDHHSDHRNLKMDHHSDPHNLKVVTKGELGEALLDNPCMRERIFGPGNNYITPMWVCPNKVANAVSKFNDGNSDQVPYYCTRHEDFEAIGPLENSVTLRLDETVPESLSILGHPVPCPGGGTNIGFDHFGGDEESLKAHFVACMDQVSG